MQAKLKGAVLSTLPCHKIPLIFKKIPLGFCTKLNCLLMTKNKLEFFVLHLLINNITYSIVIDNDKK